MDETRRLDLRPFVAVLAIAVVASTVWAAVALAAGGSSSPSSGTANDPGSYIQAQDDSQASPPDNCPDQGGGSGGGSGSDTAPNGSGSPDL